MCGVGQPSTQICVAMAVPAHAARFCQGPSLYGIHLRVLPAVAKATRVSGPCVARPVWMRSFHADVARASCSWAAGRPTTAPFPAAVATGSRGLHVSVGGRTKATESPANLTDDFVVYRGTSTWKFKAMGALGFVKSVFWGGLAYVIHFYPDTVGDMSLLWPAVGFVAATGMAAGAQSLATHSIKELTRTHGGLMARITTFNILGGSREPVEVMIDTLSSEFDELRGNYKLKVGDSKMWLLMDKNGFIPQKGAFDNLINGRTVLQAGTWLEATDPKSGKTYWYHPVTRESRWTNPMDDE